MLVATDGVIGDVYDVCGILKRYYGTSTAVLAKVTQLQAVALRGASGEKVAMVVDRIKKIVTTKEPSLDRFEKIIQMLEEEPQNIFSAFEMLLVTLFNKMLKGRRLMSEAHLTYEVDIHKLDDILQFAPSANNSSVSVFTTVANYSRAYESVLESILNTILNLEIGSKRSHLSLAAKNMGGKDGIRWERSLESGAKTSGDFLEKYSVLLYPETFAISNIKFDELPGVKAVLSEKEVYIVSKRSGNFDHIVGRVFDEDPITVYSMDSGDPLFGIGYGLGVGQVYVRS